MTGARRRILVVEDEVLVADMLAQMIDRAGMDVIGPVGTISAALQAAAEPMDAAFLDVNLRGERIDPVAALLKARNVPVIFTTGYGEQLGPLSEVGSVLAKPYTETGVRAALVRALDAQA